REVEVLDGRLDRLGRRGRGVRPQLRVEPIELPDLAVGAPAEVAVASIAQIGVRDDLEAAVRVEARRELAGQRLVVDEAVLARRADRLLVQTFGIQLPALDARDLRADQRRAIPEVRWAARRPRQELSVMRDQSLEVLPALRGLGVARGRVAERAVEM